MSFDAEKVLRGARSAAWRWTPRRLAHWREDIAQDVVTAVLVLCQRSDRVRAEAYQWATWHAVQRLTTLLRCQDETPEAWDEPEVDAPHELGPIALWRLQAVWGDLTDLQRIAVSQVVTGSSTQVAGGRVNSAMLWQARRSVLERLNMSPLAARRKDKRGCRGFTPRVEDPVKRAARLKADAAKARAKRAAHKAAKQERQCR